MTKRPMKTCSATFITRERQIPSPVRCHLTGQASMALWHGEGTHPLFQGWWGGGAGRMGAATVKRAWRFFAKLDTGTGSRNSTPVLAPRESHHPKWHFHPIFSALLLKTLKTQNPPDCPPREKQRLHGTTTHWDTTQLWNRHMANRPR